MAMVMSELVAFLRLDDKDFHVKVCKTTRAWKGLGGGIASGAKAMANALGLAAGSTAGLTTNLLRTGSAYNVPQQNSRAALRSIPSSAEVAKAHMDKLDENYPRYARR